MAPLAKKVPDPWPRASQK